METVSGNLASALGIEPGITAIIGSGGKSTLLKTLGLELMRTVGRVLLCTTTHMFPVAGVPWDGSSRREFVAGIIGNLPIRVPRPQTVRGMVDGET